MLESFSPFSFGTFLQALPTICKEQVVQVEELIQQR
jgi:hypothetical protein